MAKAAMNEIWGILFSLIKWLAWLNQVAAKVRVRFRVMMVWLEGGQEQVRGVCDGPPLGLGGMYPPYCPTWTLPPPTNLPGGVASGVTLGVLPRQR